MKESTPMGMNKTGMQMSPFDATDMRTGVPSMQPDPGAGDESAIAGMRNSYIAEADPVGSVPVPATVTGAVTAGMSMLAGNAPQLFIDKLGERLAFERTGTRLYDALLAKFDALGDGGTGATRAELERIRADEARHFAMLAHAIETIGGDPTAQTPCADLAGVESMGLMQVLSDPRTTFVQSLHAILVAEMADNAGWEVLVALADENHQASLSTEFTTALSEEQDHLEMVRQWFQRGVIGRTVGSQVAPPPQTH